MFVNINDDDKVFVVDQETGEVVSIVNLLNRKKKFPQPLMYSKKKGKYVGVDIKHPFDCLIEDQYTESVAQIDGLVHNRVVVNTEAIMDAVAEGILCKNDVKIIKFLSTKVVAHNRAFTTLKEIEESTGIGSTHLSRWFKQNTSICKVLKNRNGFVVDIHPFIVYKGSNEFRNDAFNIWYDQSAYNK